MGTEEISLKVCIINYNMLQYNIKLETVKKSLLFFVQKETCDLYNIHHTHIEFKFNDFIMNIAVHYVLKFNEEFSEYINYLKKNHDLIIFYIGPSINI